MRLFLVNRRLMHLARFCVVSQSFLHPGPATPLQAKLHALDVRGQAVREVSITAIMGTYDFATAVEDSAFTSSTYLY